MESLQYSKKVTIDTLNDAFSSKTLKAASDAIFFSDETKRCCVGFVDIVDSTRISSILTNSKICKFYGLFLNNMAMIVKGFGGKVVKNIGDSILFYFPTTGDPQNKSSFIRSMDCGFTMLQLRPAINEILKEEHLPFLNFRISYDYGVVTIAHSPNSTTDDIFGVPVNVSAKINHMAESNGMVVGGDLYQIVKSFPRYKCKLVSDFSNGCKVHYPVYSIRTYS